MCHVHQLASYAVLFVSLQPDSTAHCVIPFDLRHHLLSLFLEVIAVTCVFYWGGGSLSSGEPTYVPTGPPRHIHTMPNG